MTLFQSIAITLLIATTSFTAFAKDSNDGWELIAEKTVNFQTETDTVEPNGLFQNRKFSKIKIKCTQGTMSIKNMKVTMTDGSEKKLKTMVGTLTKGMSTRAWTLPGSEDAKFKRLEMEYKSWGNMTLNAAGMSKKAKIEVWGKKRVQEQD
ncbi:hypothetical protein V9R59_001798 [Vibrio harveyi]|uniref:hypothetical protein n=1 Tax=Vibrio harveyi TaxID=669 RepID=UPI0023F6DE97|nr:hypothetical protein [Vibrio harveyi]EKO3784022.1 hypothetical protein [Vibrio harveyi]MDF6014240.1 hypothetical protein [Vibrio harveyi]HDM8132569.1 hypothetical protein [Vibrio harveyi]